MNIKQKIGLYTIVPLFITAVGCTYFNRHKANETAEVNDSTVVQDIVKQKYDIFDQYEQAKEAYAKGTLSADSFQNIQQKFENEMQYVECGD